MVLQQVMNLNEFKIYFAKMKRPWYFAKPDNTTRLLKEIGYTNRRVRLHNNCISLPNHKIYARFVKTVIMKPLLEHLPDDKIRDIFLELFLHEVEKRSYSNMGCRTIWSLDYVRLNIIADKPYILITC